MIEDPFHALMRDLETLSAAAQQESTIIDAISRWAATSAIAKSEAAANLINDLMRSGVRPNYGPQSTMDDVTQAIKNVAGQGRWQQ